MNRRQLVRLGASSLAATLVGERASVAHPVSSSAPSPAPAPIAPQPPAETPDLNVPPAPAREFRGAWVATVANIDWPSKPGLSVDQQQAEARAILDRCKAMNLNAVVFQVRPACDALYASSLEPWSEYITGKQGQAPSPFYDPLEFWVSESHARGLELHAWFNPYRARQTDAKAGLSPTHISKRRPDLVKKYGKLLWLDPGEPDVQAHSLAVILDVVQRYDIDGIHLDDYFYPYKENDPQTKKEIPFPDEPSYKQYRASGGSMAREDWRRNNVDTFIARVYSSIKERKPWVKFGISPFGIWRPGTPPQIKGYDAYANLYADARKWFREGWCDYFAPQLYWRIDQTGQSYAVLLTWWAMQNEKNRHLWPGLYTGRHSAVEIEYQTRVTRGFSGSTGNIHFSMVTLMKGGRNDPKTMAGNLLATVYNEPALIPSSPWLSAPGAVVDPARDLACAAGITTWNSVGASPAQWAIQWRVGAIWFLAIVSGETRSFSIGLDPETVAVTAIDRVGLASIPAVRVLNAGGV